MRLKRVAKTARSIDHEKILDNAADPMVFPIIGEIILLYYGYLG